VRRALRTTFAVALAALVPAAPAAAQDLPEPGPCPPERAPVLALWLPPTVPVGFPTGLFVQRAAGGGDAVFDLQEPSALDVERLVDGRPAGTARLDFGDVRSFGRWPLRFRAGGEAVRVAFSYVERDDDGVRCRRTLTGESRAEALARPRVTLRSRVTRRFFENRNGDTRRAVRVVVRGQVRGAAPRGVLVQIGPRLRKVVRPRRGRFVVVFRFGENAGTAPAAVRVQALYPGDFAGDLFPCDDLLSTGPHDGCRVPRRSPR
jgi:hypothetical protein